MHPFRFFLLFGLVLTLFANCASQSRVVKGMHTSRIYFCNGKMYVYQDLLSTPVQRKIGKGIYVQFEIADSTKLNSSTQLFNLQDFQWIEGRYVRVLKISKQAEPGMTRLYLYDGVFSF